MSLGAIEAGSSRGVFSRWAEDRMVLGVPAYFAPGALWRTATAGAPAVGYLIANPASGPGRSPEPTYAAAVSAARAAGVEVLGYISTRWGQRPLGDVVRDIRSYRRWYGVESAFFDEAASSVASLPYYKFLAEAVRERPGALVALNPGTVPDEAYAGIADLLVVFEGPYATYRNWQGAAWQWRYPKKRFWHLVYATPQEQAEASLRAAHRRWAGVIYVTDDVPDNPWDQLPSYWAQVLRTVSRLSRGA